MCCEEISISFLSRIEALTVSGKSFRNFKTKREPEEIKTVLRSLVTNESVRVSCQY